MATIDLNRIGVFVRVVEFGSFTAAARALSAPTSSVSRAVASLEQELGVRLLHRTTRKLSLSDIGQHFFERMQAVISEAEAATLAATGFARDPRGVVRVAVMPEPEALAPIFTRIKSRYPGLEFELSVSTRTVDLVEQGVDLAVRGGALEDSSLIARKVVDSEMGVFAAPAYLERRGRPRTPAELKRHECLIYGTRYEKRPWRLKGPTGTHTLSLSGPFVSDDTAFIRGLMLQGAGLALLPLQILVPEIEAGRAVRVMPRYGYSGGLYVVWSAQKLLPTRVVVVRELLIEELGRYYARASKPSA